MVGLVPTIHVFASLIPFGVQDVDARHKGEHDVEALISSLDPEILDADADLAAGAGDVLV